MTDPSNNEMGHSSFSMNLLQKLTGSKDPTRPDADDDPELNLGLSLGGRFGVDKTRIVRSSSIAAILPGSDPGRPGLDPSRPGLARPGSGSGTGLVRTASLPVETEEEWRKRKELQSLRRLAAKRRRSEKQSVSRGEREEYVMAMGRVGSSVGLAFGSGNWEFGGGGGADGVSDGSVPGSGSVDLQGSVESRHLQGSGGESEASPASVQSSQERTNKDGANSSRPIRPKSESSGSNKGKEIRSNALDMPCVFTQGDGPGGRRIEGILYKYGKGEEVKIMCVCHGSFLTPAEFVRHAGGTDVVHPLKHIVVNPNSSSYL
ncbi:ninja-family protein AFP3-like [Bidens hawaiensis]|uniref:ninja-family protein AFP3-like n=1 Tax=Bidens hawaiensis TaxID=980011 RepID=UPI0040490C4B